LRGADHYATTRSNCAARSIAYASQAIGYRRFLVPQRAALEKLAACRCDWLRDDDRLHLSAAADRAARMAEELESIRERAALTHETLTDLRAEQIDQRSLIIAWRRWCSCR
jgi:zinc transporter